MLILGRNSASYCTHNAATAASCIIKWEYLNDILTPKRKQKQQCFTADETKIQKPKGKLCKYPKQFCLKERHTLATPLGGYSPFSLGSTHCLTLSSLNLGVALTKIKFVSPNDKITGRKKRMNNLKVDKWTDPGNKTLLSTRHSVINRFPSCQKL